MKVQPRGIVLGALLLIALPVGRAVNLYSKSSVSICQPETQVHQLNNLSIEVHESKDSWSVSLKDKYAGEQASGSGRTLSDAIKNLAKDIKEKQG